MSFSLSTAGRRSRSRSHSRSRSRGPNTIVTMESRLTRVSKSDMTRLALQHSNENLESRMTKIHSNAKKLEREVLALSRHIKDASSPFLGTWEADLLTRLIEVSYIRQTDKFPHGVSIGETNFAERDVLSRAYSNAARRVKLTTIIRLGLEEKHYEAVQNYSDVVVYRSPNPFDTERPFARWLVQEGMENPDKFAFWARLYPVCYGRSVYESANLI